jgi:kumamolisin
VGINGLQPYLHPNKHFIARPNSLSGTNPPYLPGQIAQAYDATGLYNFNINGTGQTIAIVIDTFPNSSDLVSYWSTCNINQSINNIDFIQVVSGTYPAPSGEETLDVEWSSSIAPGAKVRVYGTTSLEDTFLDEAYNQIYSDATSNSGLDIHQMSMSYGGGESTTTQSQVNTDEQYFSELASAGVTIFASSGDGGSTPNTSSGSAGNETGPLQVETPADDPYVTGVGGTSLALASNGNESSETVWNNLNSNPNYGASGGGASGITFTSHHVTETVSFARPGWQTGTGVPSGTNRLVPDVAGPADPNNGGLVILDGSQAQYGGTSWASPTWAGFCAVLNQARANAGMSSLGLLGPQIYPLIGTANFRDITSGNNFTGKSPTEYAATTGYDETTGVGVPLVQTLAQTLTGSTIPVITTQPLAQVVTAGPSVTFSAAASGTAPLAYQWLQDGTAISGATSASYTISSTSGNNTGAYSVIVSNPFGSATSNSASLVAATSQPTAQTVTSGNSVTFSIVVPSAGAPYSYQWLFNGSAIAMATNSSYTIDDAVAANAGNYSVLVTDAYGAVTTNAVSLTVNPAPVAETDTPTMPPWALLVLAVLIIFVATRQKLSIR